MDWKIEFDPRALKDIKKLDKTAQKEIVQYLKNRVLSAEDPRRLGKALQGPLKGLRRYRFANYRIICQIQDKRLIIFVLTVGHRKDIYQKNLVPQ